MDTLTEQTASERQAPPRIYADGVHDDSEAFRWYFAHRLPLPELPDGAIMLITPLPRGTVPAFCAWPREADGIPDHRSCSASE